MPGWPVRMVTMRGISIPKGSDPNEDTFLISTDGKSCALADGASVSYDPRRWARFLCSRYLDNRRVDRRWLLKAAEDFDRDYNRDVMTWSQQASYDRGSFSTLVGVEMSAVGGLVRLFAFGDSLVVLSSGNNCVSTFPYNQPQQFDRHPQLLGSARQSIASLTDSQVEEASIYVSFGGDPDALMLLMTDALGRWFLENRRKESIYDLIAHVKSGTFEEFVIEERSCGRLRRDDTTLLIVRPNGDLSSDS